MKNKLYVLLFLAFLFSGTTLWAQQRATPKAGEGISTFLLRHNRSPKKYYDDFIELNKQKLGKNNVLKMGVTYVIPPVKNTTAKNTETKQQPSKSKASKIGTTINEPLFGKELANVKVTSNRLAGACFYVVSGHGGPDPGAIGRVGKHELHEDEYAYDIALRLARNLMQEGAEVHIIIQDAKDGIRDDTYLSNSKRETCMGDPIPLNQVQRLQQRCNKINALYQKDRRNYSYCRAIFIHIDSRSKGKQTDVFFYHSSKKAESKRLANNMKDTFESKYGKHQPNRGFSGTVNGRNLYVLSHTTPASVFVELGNIQNTFDQRRLVINSNRQALAKWLMEGFLKDYKDKK
ncbi:N-acetylmuramoyl-L-alanine amidase [uncultured Bacteroides sp.]|uniref:N-acetylmuramoyl-L-alanine amidase family protein n=1 Tax=uncultured Bacteroides sp. TaxID=162156 RepID=UPI0025DB6D9A|nr:N-acetylmuramoyl-L-alanine amidase [uncultured Bacteroides sp.]